MGITMKTASIAVALCAILVATYAITEVQELGNDDSTKSLAASEEANNEEIGEGAGVGRRAAASFLMTSGSFTLSAGWGTVPVTTKRKTRMSLVKALVSVVAPQPPSS